MIEATSTLLQEFEHSTFLGHKRELAADTGTRTPEREPMGSFGRGDGIRDADAASSAFSHISPMKKLNNRQEANAIVMSVIMEEQQQAAQAEEDVETLDEDDLRLSEALGDDDDDDDGSEDDQDSDDRMAEKLIQQERLRGNRMKKSMRQEAAAADGKQQPISSSSSLSPAAAGAGTAVSQSGILDSQESVEYDFQTADIDDVLKKLWSSVGGMKSTAAAAAEKLPPTSSFGAATAGPLK